MKGSIRLKAIANTIDQKNYFRVYDTCCDHGKLGLLVSNMYPKTKITFVDTVQSIIERLALDPRFDNYELRCMPAENLKIQTKPSLVIIAGVGGELASKIIQGICDGNAYRQSFDFLISPNNKSYLVRRKLSSYQFKSVDEKIVTDNKLCYEVIYSKYSEGEIFDDIGKKAFDLSDASHQDFLRKKKGLYKVKSKYDYSMHNLYIEYSKLFDEFESKKI